jgi:hypothetical protein
MSKPDFHGIKVVPLDRIKPTLANVFKNRFTVLLPSVKTKNGYQTS